MAASTSENAVVSFGVFEADLRSGQLRKCGVKIKIQELPFQALKLFLTKPNEVLSREDLRHALWPDDVFVDFDRGIISAINRLRDTLSDSAENPRFVETVGRRGYRWIAPIHFSETVSELPLEGAGNEKSSRANPMRLWITLSASLILAALVVVSFFLARRNLLQKFPAFSGGAPAPRARTSHRESEQFYLQGRYYWEKRTPDSLNKAVDSFTQAIVHDPSYAPAYVGLADCYNLLREYTVLPGSEAYPRALAAAKKAVELDPQSSAAHASLAFASFYGMWDAATADREFRRATELDPSNAVAHHWYATYLSSMRRFPESLAEIERAQALEPSSKSVLADKGMLLFDAGHDKDALVLLKQMEESEPDFISPHRYLKFIYLLKADYSDYLKEARKEALLMHDVSALAVADASEKGFAARGGKGLLQALTQQQKESYGHGRLSPYLLATTYAIMGDRQEALRYLKTAYDQHVDGMAEIGSNPAFATLSNEPAFRELVAEVGLPPRN